MEYPLYPRKRTLKVSRVMSALCQYGTCEKTVPQGDCDRGYRYPIRITRSTLSNAGDTAFTIAGKVGPTGLIRVTLSHGSNASANGRGQLAGNTGSGSWNSNSCSGTWTAERRGS
jgi:hypothetical protein